MVATASPMTVVRNSLAERTIQLLALGRVVRLRLGAWLRCLGRIARLFLFEGLRVWLRLGIFLGSGLLSWMMEWKNPLACGWQRTLHR